ncbi:hypothetical protein DY037_00705 [Apilactobacillus micheneri]|uniref:Uncharacterized protein n=1 Tax=Apilactobacillus micheneri TaxID=1899430 RepID=A0A9Q8ILZ4_9LACO|nr:hypothetical protein [Apilactobacillus micheneri]TPR39925.1 hypothetical protein DY121_03560 [Apilactobacillus micheneri]TPR41740.1 hypothetical protein DY123_04200 [Apilactobacillus micheneri]TPR44127.1 hypothetical protein DY130_03555 [Apilactobacillus micheneri]TPR45751.1 hypothetical protein DY128_03555 [Apilactobacillus micheneri]TPR50502.1 hypothetical protein DY037_00705 [Apilactobacillus micheneri]
MFDYNILSLVQKIAKDYPNQSVSLDSILDYVKNDLKTKIPDKNKLINEYVKTKGQFNLVTVGDLTNKLLKICDDDAIKLPKQFKNKLINDANKRELIDLDKFGSINKNPNKTGGISVKFTLDNLIKNGLPKVVTYKELDYRVKDYLNYVVTNDQSNIDNYVNKEDQQLDKFIELISEIAIQVPDKKASRNTLLSLLKGNQAQNKLLLCSILLDAHMMAAKDFRLFNEDDVAFMNKYPKQHKALNKMIDDDLIMNLKGYENNSNDRTTFNMQDFVKVPKCVTYGELLKNLRNVQIK